ncbi:HIT-like domain-containing protein [Phycomyces blakesleeanus]|uniref:HIT-like domain-containing protein n=1 Tax=Phycomyces blakesleeanus TaxID=4837 RepID=A0ABR3BBT9_PHYBL
MSLRLLSNFINRNCHVIPKWHVQGRFSSTHTHLSDNCIFCKIIRGDIPSMKILETDESFAFMDIDPLSKGHCLVIPKYHAEFLHQVPDEYLVDVMPLTKKIAIAAGLKEYNVLQNNGKLANQAVPHVHFHLIPKPNQTQGLSIHWKPNKMDKKDIETKYQQILENLKVPL